MRSIKKLDIQKVYDLQNSSRTKFYQRILFPNSNLNKWSSSETTLPNDKTKEVFDENPVLDRFDHQLKTSGLITKHTMFPDFSWSCSDINNIKDEYKLNKYTVKTYYTDGCIAIQPKVKRNNKNKAYNFLEERLGKDYCEIFDVHPDNVGWLDNKPVIFDYVACTL